MTYRCLGINEQIADQRVLPQSAETAMGEDAHVSLLAAADRGDLAIGEPIAPQIDRFSLRCGEVLKKLVEPRGQVGTLDENGWVDGASVFVGRRGHAVVRCRGIGAERLLATRAAQMVNSPIATHAIEPRRRVIAHTRP